MSTGRLLRQHRIAGGHQACSSSTRHCRHPHAFVSPLRHFVSELSIAVVTRIWQDSGVDPPMDKIRHTLAETLAAGLANKRSFSTMNPFMVLKC